MAARGRAVRAGQGEARIEILVPSDGLIFARPWRRRPARTGARLAILGFLPGKQLQEKGATPVGINIYTPCSFEPIGRRTTPSNGSPVVTKPQSAMISLRASATIMVLRVPLRLSAVRARYHNVSALCFCVLARTKSDKRCWFSKSVCEKISINSKPSAAGRGGRSKMVHARKDLARGRAQ